MERSNRGQQIAPANKERGAPLGVHGSVHVRDVQKPVVMECLGDFITRRFTAECRRHERRLGHPLIDNTSESKEKLKVAMREFAGTLIARHRLYGMQVDDFRVVRAIDPGQEEVVQDLAMLAKRIVRAAMIEFETIGLDPDDDAYQALRRSKECTDSVILSSSLNRGNTKILVEAFAARLAYGKLPAWYWKQWKEFPLIATVQKVIEHDPVHQARIKGIADTLAHDIEYRSQLITPELRSVLHETVKQTYLQREVMADKQIFDQLREAFATSAGGWLGIHAYDDSDG